MWHREGRKRDEVEQTQSWQALSVEQQAGVEQSPDQQFSTGQQVNVAQPSDQQAGDSVFTNEGVQIAQPQTEDQSKAEVQARPEAHMEAGAETGVQARSSAQTQTEIGAGTQPQADAALKRDLSKLKRSELLEIMLAQSEEIDRLRQELAKKDEELADRRITIAESGSIAEASLRLTRVFEEAQRAADLYLDNVRRESSEREFGERGSGTTGLASVEPDLEQSYEEDTNEVPGNGGFIGQKGSTSEANSGAVINSEYLNEPSLNEQPDPEYQYDEPSSDEPQYLPRHARPAAGRGEG